MNIRDRLHDRLRQCRRDRDAVNQQAAQAAHHYVERRLAQLDTQFSRHGFGWRMPTIWNAGLMVVPAIGGWHQVDHALKYLGPVLNRRRSERIHKIGDVSRDLDHWSQLIKDEFGKSIAHALSPKLKTWGVILDLLPPQPPPPVSEWQRAAVNGAIDTDSMRIGPMHRKHGCGYL